MWELLSQSQLSAVISFFFFLIFDYDVKLRSRTREAHAVKIMQS